jgi:predicted RNase H-like nuclease
LVEWRVAPEFSAVVDIAQSASVIAIDTPIGLLEAAQPGGRVVDRLARSLLGPLRGRSVFSPPVRRVLASASYAQALASNRQSSPARIGLSAQCFNICHLIRQVDEWITPVRQERAFEIHPELCFFEANGGAPLLAPKKTRDGHRQRCAILDKLGVRWSDVALGSISRRHAAPDDLLDAAIAAWTAWRHAHGMALRLPEDPPVDARGLRMEMWR